ncbi:MAG: DNA mismatch repair protein MutS [Tidjanibacter sp.]|nr:DNA mismatch repair protein MutS [Tidjanibacter sp.]
MQQYFTIKATHPDAILLFRVGDFYETYGEDAVEAASILGIALTRKGNGPGNYIEMAGFPYHAVNTYLPKLVRAGRRVAVCEQLEDPKSVKGLVKRGVVELVTPGVVMDESVLSSRENIFLAALHFDEKRNGIALLDLSTGEFYVGEGNDDYTDKLIAAFQPKEIIYERGKEAIFSRAVSGNNYSYRLDKWVFNEEVARKRLCKQFGVKSLKGYGIERMGAAITAAGAALHYLDYTEHKDIAHIGSISRIDSDGFVWIDRFTIRNLELLSAGSTDGKGSLIGAIDRTSTPMGGRLLRHWVTMPIKDVERLNRRLDVVEAVKSSPEMSEAIAESLGAISDLERLSSRIAVGRITPREVNALRESLGAIEQLKILLGESESDALRSVGERLHAMEEQRRTIARTIYPDPQNNQIQKGGIIASGVDIELDELRSIALHGKDRIAEIQQSESQRTGIPSLRVSYNNVFGYYIEVRNTHKDKVPAEWIRKQTLVGAERYITAELKEYEEKVLGAEEKILAIEARLWDELLGYLSNSLAELQRNASVVAHLDCLASLARLATERGYVRPEISDDKRIEIRDGRHPVIEMMMPVGEQYVPNDVVLDTDTQQIMMITGPNMSGKSALLRQTAHIVLLAQIGSFVPASSAHIGIVDKIFTRVGASDNISQGESTFMVEMLESAAILNNVTDRSLVLLDEIGRGTSTYDGISIAWSMVEYLHNHPRAKAKTLFATHYHELNQMEESLPRVKNYNVSVKEVNRSVLFLRKLQRGGTDNSFGIHVARLAGMPSKVVERAEEILGVLVASHADDSLAVEQSATKGKGKAMPKVKTTQPSPQMGIQLSMFQLEDPVLVQVRDQIRDLDINNLTPLEALNTLSEIKKITGL